MVIFAVETRGLSFSYPLRDGGERRVLDGLDLKVRPGEIYGLLGPNGSGKTTAFHLLSTYEPAPAGRAFVFGKDAGAEEDEVRRLIGVVFQKPSLDRHLTVEENLRHQGRLYGLGGTVLSGRIEAGLRSLGLWERRWERTATLSGGLKRRVELAKGLLHQPKLLLLDEPSTGLDPRARLDLWEALKTLREAGTTVLLTTHWMEEAERCDRLAILDSGKLVAEGSPAQLTSRVGGDVVTVGCENAEALAAGVKEKLGFDAYVVDGKVRIESAGGYSLILKIAEAFPGAARSITLGKPTLEDVFIHETGRSFRTGETSP